MVSASAQMLGTNPCRRMNPPCRRIQSVPNPSFRAMAQLAHPQRFRSSCILRSTLLAQALMLKILPAPFHYGHHWESLGVRRAKKSSSCATMPLPSPRTIDSNSLEGGIGVFQRAYSEGCFFPNLPPSPVGDTPFHFIHISFPRLRSCAGTNLTGPSCEGPPVFKRNHTMRELSPIWRQHAYIQMPGLP
jgi:hypothetical protein